MSGDAWSTVRTLVLVGPHGAGKTTIARRIGSRPGWTFHDEIGERLRRDALARFLVLSGAVDAADIPVGWRRADTTADGPLLQVTDAVTVAPDSIPAFVQPWKSGDRIAKAGTLIGWNAALPVTTPYDDCVLVMPGTHNLKPGGTAVRLGRFED